MHPFEMRHTHFHIFIQNNKKKTEFFAEKPMCNTQVLNAEAFKRPIAIKQRNISLNSHHRPFLFGASCEYNTFDSFTFVRIPFLAFGHIEYRVVVPYHVRYCKRSITLHILSESICSTVLRFQIGFRLHEYTLIYLTFLVVLYSRKKNK